MESESAVVGSSSCMACSTAKTGGLPCCFALVVMVVLSYCLLNMWMAMQVGKARKRYDVPFPALYASDENKNAKAFNCIQRGHQNSLEFMPVFFVLEILSGLKFPKIAGVLGIIYIVGRYFYFTGYATGDPQKRLKYGKFNFLALMGLMVCTAASGVQFFRH